jgi:hypothetical protein
VRAAAPEIRAEALRLLDDWRGLLGKHVGTSRQLLRKLLDRDTRFVFYPMAEGDERWYELGVVPTLDRFLGAVPSLKKSGGVPNGNRAAWTDGQTAENALDAVIVERVQLLLIVRPLHEVFGLRRQ